MVDEGFGSQIPFAFLEDVRDGLGRIGGGGDYILNLVLRSTLFLR